MYCTQPETRTARKQHRCMNCAELIEIGDTYQRWMSADDGQAVTNKMHPECLSALQKEAEGGYFDYMIYGGDRPEKEE